MWDPSGLKGAAESVVFQIFFMTMIQSNDTNNTFNILDVLVRKITYHIAYG